MHWQRVKMKVLPELEKCILLEIVFLSMHSSVVNLKGLTVFKVGALSNSRRASYAEHLWRNCKMEKSWAIWHIFRWQRAWEACNSLCGGIRRERRCWMLRSLKMTAINPLHSWTKHCWKNIIRHRELWTCMPPSNICGTGYVRVVQRKIEFKKRWLQELFIGEKCREGWS